MTRSRDMHLDTRTALDHLDQRLDAASARRVEAHLARPCPECRERLRQLGELVETMRSDRLPAVPERLTRRALEVFEPHAAQEVAAPSLASLARLLFDSLATPLPATARRSVGEARRLRYALGEAVLELELERDAPSTMALRGRLQAPDAALWSIRVEAGEESRPAAPDAFGSFLLEALPDAPCQVRLEGPQGAFVIRDLSP